MSDDLMRNDDGERSDEDMEARKMSKDRLVSRRELLRLGGLGAMGVVAGRLVVGTLNSDASAAAGNGVANAKTGFGVATALPDVDPPGFDASDVDVRLAATDGYVKLPGRVGDTPLYVFGFRDVPTTATQKEMAADVKGDIYWPSPILAFNVADGEAQVALTNIGLVVRPDLDDAHTIHWHGFRNPVAAFDGVPETSISVPPGRDFIYYYRLDAPGTYIYHCHFEDSEHVQMGMDGVVYQNPAKNTKTEVYAYEDGDDGSTQYDRQYALLLNEVDPVPHDNLEAVQEFVWSDYKPKWWVINGRCYPDTVEGNAGDTHTLGGDVSAELPSQPVSSLIQANGGERILVRLGNLGFQQHSMRFEGLTVDVVGEDASYLGTGQYSTSTVYIAPGETRDVMFTAPVFTTDREVHIGIVADGETGNYNRYFLKNRNQQRLNNGGTAGLGGMATEIRVYERPLDVQKGPDENFPLMNNHNVLRGFDNVPA